ncbi:MAG: valine--tRNA ligase, partial [Phycisphaerales bacterium]|nr:valine--tRNA ligase [Phycisphaerales bacterium]
MLDRTYQPSQQEPRIREKWLAANAFHADPVPVNQGTARAYSIVIPPPNVTAALHLGHALNNTIQDVLTRAHRMMCFETLWMPGTDHAGIATQTVVDKRLKAEGKKALADYKKMEAEGANGREQFVGLVQAWKDEYERAITNQLEAMGCSCDWERQRFTMDETCARAVREAFFRLFRDGLIYRGKRLVNWDPVTRTALADDEVEMREVDGNFYYLRYPLVRKTKDGQTQPVTWSELAALGYPDIPRDDAHGGDERAWIAVATTRPETYLGDTAVAINPKDARATALEGLFVELPLVGRVIPIITDDYVVMADPESGDAKAKFATGFLKVTPAHDPNDYEIGQRHGLAKINVMADDASISDKHGWEDVGDAHIFVGLSREEARKKVVMEFKARGLVEEVRPHRHSVGHSYRSHVAIEPYLSDQWYVKVTDDRLRGFAQRALANDQRSTETHVPQKGVEGDGELRFYPARYAKTYETWHDNLRDWCISRQLWWGHRVPVWAWYPHDDFGGAAKDFSITEGPSARLKKTASLLEMVAEACGLSGSIFVRCDGDDIQSRLLVCSANEEADRLFQAVDEMARGGDDSAVLTKYSDLLRSDNAASLLREFAETEDGTPFQQDPDVLDTWFSSALWPMSTMGWPQDGAFDGLLEAFNPTNVLCTAREIITLWVSRMVMFQRYLTSPDGGKTPGTLPFGDVFIHAMIQDGEGRKMSKSLGNGVDPLDIIATHGSDAMRFTLCNMTTQTQDVRMPVERDERTGKNTSPKFDIGRNFVTKLWNAAKFAMMKIEDGQPAWAKSPSKHGVTFNDLTLPDVWILSRCAQTVAKVNEALKNYEFSVYAQAMYDLLWRDYCDWYLEAVKPTVAESVGQQSVLRAVLDSVLRLLHPIMPYVTEAIWEAFSKIERAPIRGLELAP